MLEALGAEVTVKIGPGYPPVVNDERVTEYVRSAASELLGPDATLPIEPMTLSEDFSFLARATPGTFFFLGAAPAEPRMHHRSDFDIDESAIPIGTAVLAAGAVRLLQEMAGSIETTEDN